MSENPAPLALIYSKDSWIHVMEMSQLESLTYDVAIVLKPISVGSVQEIANGTRISGPRLVLRLGQDCVSDCLHELQSVWGIPHPTL